MVCGNLYSSRNGRARASRLKFGPAQVPALILATDTPKGANLAFACQERDDVEPPPTIVEAGSRQPIDSRAEGPRERDVRLAFLPPVGTSAGRGTEWVWHGFPVKGAPRCSS